MRRLGLARQESPSFIYMSDVWRLCLCFRQKRIDTKYHCAKEHKFGHDTHDLDESLATCALCSCQVNCRDVRGAEL